MREELISEREGLVIRRRILEPNEATPWHVDSGHRFSVIVRGERLALEFQDGSEPLEFAVAPGEAGWDPPEPRLHRAVNVGGSPYEEVVTYYRAGAHVEPPPGDDDPRQAIAARIGATSRLSGDFLLRSGQRSTTYFDKYRFEADPELLRAVARLLVDLLPAETEVVAGLEMGGIPVATALSQVTGLPAAFLRKQAKTYGTARYAEGVPLRGRRVVLVEDVVSSGGAILDTLTMLRADGVEPVAALCVIDRQSGGVESLAAAGLPLHALFRMSEIP